MPRPGNLRPGGRSLALRPEVDYGTVRAAHGAIHCSPRFALYPAAVDEIHLQHAIGYHAQGNPVNVPAPPVTEIELL